SGFMNRLIGLMPRANGFDGPNTVGITSTGTPLPIDGLNTAVHRWTRRTVAGPAGGNGENVDAYKRRQFNNKIDQHLNQNNSFTGAGSGCPPICTASDLGNTAPLTSFTETLSKTRGTHAFKGGVEFRHAYSRGWAAGGLMPIVTGGPGAIPVTGIDRVAGL